MVYLSQISAKNHWNFIKGWNFVNPQIIVFLVTLVTLILFVDGRLRYDFVSLLSMLILTFTGIVKPENAFLGFSHPAVITVAAVLIITSALIKTGVINRLVTIINLGSNKLTLKIMGLMTITALLSAFMNNVGALALIMPISMGIAKDNDISPSQLLMPIAFASLLGGMITSIGTPPNLVISTYRIQAGKEAFSFFSFAPVGLALTFAGILFTTILGWKLIPVRKSTDLKEGFELEDYLFELLVTEDCPSRGIRLRDICKTYKVSLNIISIIRDGQVTIPPSASERIFPNDILIVKSLSGDLNNLINKACFKLKGAKTDKLLSDKYLKSNDIALIEVVLRDDSPLIGRTAVETQLRNRYNANLIALSSKGVTKIERLKVYKFSVGDVLLLQVPKTHLNDMYLKMRCLPLAEREIDLPITTTGKEQFISVFVFLISIVLSTLGIMPVQITFTASALLLVIFNVISPREFYQAIEWPTVIMIGSLFSLGEAIETSGLSENIASFLLNLSIYFPPTFMVVMVMFITICLTNLINNTAATILMAPIGISIANSLGVSVDTFLMSICIGASTSFMTPIAHQSNTLVMGPGGYKYTDYVYLGLPLSIISLVIGAPLILLVWPL